VTAIEWTDETWNPIRASSPEHGNGWHCERVSEGCRNCYAEVINRDRFGTGLAYTRPNRDRVEISSWRTTLGAPLRWRKPRRIFVCSMTDLFGEWVPFELIDWVFAVMALAPQHTYQVLTKRPERMREYLVGRRDWAIPNLWLGVSVEDQVAAESRIPVLLDTPAAVRFLSCEPLLGPVDLEPWLATGLLHWVICGGES
jgi:protein gp37